MKKFYTVILAIILLLSMQMTVFAAETIEQAADGTYTVEVSGETSGAELMIIVVKGDELPATVSALDTDSILYINSVTIGSGGSASLTFPLDTYSDATVYKTGGTAGVPVAIAEIEAVRILGDVNGNGSVNSLDVQRLYNHVNGTSPLDDETVGDVNGSGTVNSLDVQRLYNHVNGTALLN